MNKADKYYIQNIQKILGRSDFDRCIALQSHRKVLQKNLEQTKKLLKTIDKTIEHLQGKTKTKRKSKKMFIINAHCSC